MKGRTGRAAAAVLLPGLLLVLASLSLVTSQHRARGLFVDLGRLQAQARELEAEGNRLRIELGKASQPAAVAAAARALGLRPAEARQTIYLPLAATLDVAAVDPALMGLAPLLRAPAAAAVPMKRAPAPAAGTWRAP